MLPDTVRFCSDDTSAHIELKNNFGKNVSIEWATPVGVVSNIRKLSVAKKSGRYRLKVLTPQGSFKDSTFVLIYPKPKLLLRDTVLCKGQALVLDAKNTGLRYLWNTRETTQKIKIENSGYYWVKVSNRGCSLTDTVKVKFLLNAVPLFSENVSFCMNEENKTLSVKVNPNSKVIWNTGATTPAISVTKEGVYWVKTESKDCGMQIDSARVKLKACDCELLVPNSFTPNEDNKNDYFFPVFQCEYSFYSLVISDRWANVVFSTNNINAKWDGRFKGNLCPEDIYVYRIESVEKGNEKKLIRSGHISLFR